MIPEDLQPGDTIRARFEPKRQDTLRPELVDAIGLEAEFSCSWIINEEDGGPYVGQGAFHTKDERFHHYWVPQEDLDVL